jgi:hypothetical protein
MVSAMYPTLDCCNHYVNLRSYTLRGYTTQPYLPKDSQIGARFITRARIARDAAATSEILRLIAAAASP